MKILIKPSDIIERCVWDAYETYVLDKSVNIDEHIKENKEFEIEEKDALVIGILRCVETDNLIHRFNQYLEHYMNNRSYRVSDSYKVRKKSIIPHILDFKRKFPKSWEPNKLYQKGLEDVLVYVDKICKEVDELPVEKVTEKNIVHEYINCNAIKKMLTYHN